MPRVDEKMKNKGFTRMTDHIDRNRLNKKAKKESYHKRKQKQRIERWA